MQKVITTMFAILVSSSVLAENGDIIFTNINRSQLGVNDIIQFQLITNNHGLVTTGVLAAEAKETLTKWSVSDTTENFVVYIRDISKKQMEYVPCSARINYQNNQPIIKISGWSDGERKGCAVT